MAEFSKTTRIHSSIVEEHFKRFYDFLKRGVLCDVTIKSRTKSFKCHRLVLASCSHYFEALFSPSFKGSCENVIRMHEIDDFIMKSVIKFAYTGQIDLDFSNIQNMLSTSRFLLFDSLTEECVKFMRHNIDLENCFDIYELSQQLGLQTLSEYSDLFIKNHFNEIMLRDKFLSITVDNLETLLFSEDLYVEDEEEICEALLKWVNHDVNNRSHFIPRLLPKIRLPLLRSGYLKRFSEEFPMLKDDPVFKELFDESLTFGKDPSHNIKKPRVRRLFPRNSYAGN